MKKMKKIIAVMIAIMMFALPVLSFAESTSAKDITLKVSVNPEFLNAMSSDDMTLMANIIEQAGLVFHTQDNLVKAALTLADISLVDFVAEIADEGILLGSNLIPKNAILVSYEKIQEVLSAVQSELNQTEKDDAAAKEIANAMLNIDFSHTTEVLTNAVVIDQYKPETWDLDSDVPAQIIQADLSNENAVEFFAAALQDIKNSKILDQLYATAGLDMTVTDEDFDEALEEIAGILPDEGNFISVYIGMSNEGNPVYFAFVTNYKETTITNITPVTADDGTINYETEYNTVAKAASFQMAQATSDSSISWFGGLTTQNADAESYDYYGFELVASENALNIDAGYGYSADGGDPEYFFTISFEGTATDDSADFSLSLAMPDSSTGESTVLGSLDGSLKTYGNDFAFDVSLNIANIDAPIATLSLSSADGEIAPSIADRAVITLADLSNEETINSLMEQVENSLGGLLSITQ